MFRSEWNARERERERERDRERESSEVSRKEGRNEEAKRRTKEEARRPSFVAAGELPLASDASSFHPSVFKRGAAEGSSRELDVMVARGKCLNFSLSKISR